MCVTATHLLTNTHTFTHSQISIIVRHGIKKNKWNIYEDANQHLQKRLNSNEEKKGIPL